MKNAEERMREIAMCSVVRVANEQNNEELLSRTG